MFEVIKRYKRLHIIESASGASVYTPPDFLRVPSRGAMRELANAFVAAGRRDISAIIQFEARWSKRR